MSEEEIVILPNQGNYFDENGGFAWVSGNRQKSGFHHCKESFTNDFYRRGLDFHANRQRLMYRQSRPAGGFETYREAVENLLNAFDRAMKFPLSKVYIAQRGYPYKARVFLVDVSSKWTKYGPMIHLLALLVRNARTAVPTENWKDALTYLTNHTPRATDRYQFETAQTTIIELVKAKGVPQKVTGVPNWDFEGGGNTTSTILKGMGIVQYAERRLGSALYS